MGRQLKRVPLDFNYPLNETWKGYDPSIETLKDIKEIFKLAPYLKECDSTSDICIKCKKTINDCDENVCYCIWHNNQIKNEWYKEVPVGEGYQLWENTSEGSPQSPVFKTLEELCAWCETNATTFSNFKASKEEWFDMLKNNNFYHKEGNCRFL